MTKNIRLLSVFFTIILLAFLSFAYQYAGPLAQATATPTLSKARATQLALEAQAGHSDGILLLGILIFIFIAGPIILGYRGLKSP
jgi:hypothetical protein